MELEHERRKKMKILQVIHGYPPYYMAGSEVYTWNLARELAKEHDVHVFTRIENPYAEPYELVRSVEDQVTIHRVNKPQRDYTFRDKYLDPRIDSVFRSVMQEVQPEVVHFGHLSHLSSNLPAVAKKEFGVPTLFTIHDFWLHCYRGQLIRSDLTRCAGPTVSGCLDCAREILKDLVDGEQIEERRRQTVHVTECIDLFLAPSRTVQTFYLQQGVPESKVVYSPYGFDVERIAQCRRELGSGPLRFGFMGRIIPVKGIQVLLRAFRLNTGRARLDIWGSTGADTPWLNALAEGDSRITFHGSYHNGQVQDVLDGMDVMVAPSVWLENSPLVIQEAMLAGVPVITSDIGGMAELVKDGVDGFLVPPGDVDALAALLQRLIDAPDLLTGLKPERKNVRTIRDDADACVSAYRALVPERRVPLLPVLPAPWRVTFVTNPGLCNLHCPMCDTHSPFAEKSPRNLPILDFGVVERTVLELAQRGLHEIIPSTMGEPLLYPQFDKLIALAARTGVKINLTTNGTFPRRGVDAWTQALLPVVSDVKFSANGIDPAVVGAVMPGLNPEIQLRNIQRYLELRRLHEAAGGRRTTATVQVTFMERNLDELARILVWAAENGIDRFKGHHLWVTWPQLAEQSLRRSPEARKRWNDRVGVLRELAGRVTKPDGTHIRLDNVDLLSVEGEEPAPATSLCPFVGCEAWVEADGTFQVCCCPSEERKAFGEFGSLLEKSFMEIWTSPRYLEFASGWGGHPNCRKCNMRRTRKENANA
jgi:glycosyltransferase involved in cell wall biosynthesis/MoaA/NifB/PqqE/SkfB family radical SAM enzyme